MAAYPADLVRNHRLLDGRTVTIRPIRADDAPRVHAFLASTSEESRYTRFHEWVHAPSGELIRFMTEIDYDRHMAFVCSVAHAYGESIVGEARYIANPDGASCDFAILVDDAWRKSGVAGLLMEALIRAARERGLGSIEGTVLSGNTAMLRFAHALGFAIEPMGPDLRTVRISLDLRARIASGIEAPRRAELPGSAAGAD